MAAGAKAVKLTHGIDPGNMVGCVILDGAAYPYTCNSDDALKAQAVIHKANDYCGDVRARGAYPSFAKKLWAEEGVSVKASAEDAEALKDGTVDLFTSSYYSSTTATDAPAVPIAAGSTSGRRRGRGGRRGPGGPHGLGLHLGRKRQETHRLTVYFPPGIWRKNTATILP